MKKIIYAFTMLTLALTLTDSAVAQTYNPSASSVSGNTATGTGAVQANKGQQNTADGKDALKANFDGFGNVAVGSLALRNNGIGDVNTAVGYLALFANTQGINNTAIGTAALQQSKGHYNTAIGWEAGSLLQTGRDNIYLGHFGVASESGTMRLGQAGVQTRVFILDVNILDTLKSLQAQIDALKK